MEIKKKKKKEQQQNAAYLFGEPWSPSLFPESNPQKPQEVCKLVFSTRGDFAPPKEGLAMSKDTWLSQLGKGVLLAYSEWGPGRLLSTLQRA